MQVRVRCIHLQVNLVETELCWVEAEQDDSRAHHRAKMETIFSELAFHGG
jgi:hypothetical protein